jgi:hypothetical protein
MKKEKLQLEAGQTVAFIKQGTNREQFYLTGRLVQKRDKYFGRTDWFIEDIKSQPMWVAESSINRIIK